MMEGLWAGQSSYPMEDLYVGDVGAVVLRSIIIMGGWKVPPTIGGGKTTANRV